jgi:3-oxoacyl-[acyl-carrier protein] reductase
MLMTLVDKVALVTGSSRGIGRASALALARNGCHVGVNYLHSHAEAANVVTEIRALDRCAVAVQADVADENAVRRLLSEVETELGPVDILVNNAGILINAPLDCIDLATWHRTVDTNLTSSFLVTQAVLPAMRSRRWGRLIFLSSIAAQTGGVIGPHYAASKAGQLGLMRSYATLLAAEGITSNAIAPALVETDMIRGNPNIRPDLIPVGRFGTADEIADAVVLLASNGYINGQTISLNGGWFKT